MKVRLCLSALLLLLLCPSAFAHKYLIDNQRPRIEHGVKPHVVIHKIKSFGLDAKKHHYPAAPPLPKLTGVGDVPGCLYGADPVPTMLTHHATVLRVGISPPFIANNGWVDQHGSDGSALPCIRDAQRVGFKVNLSIRWFNQWPTETSIAYVHQVVAIYAPTQPWAISLGNEQENRDMSKGVEDPGETPQQYSDIWKILVPSVRKSFPHALLVAGEVPPWGLTWLRDAAILGLPGAQALAAHPYQGYPGVNSPQDFITEAKKFGLPMWFTEGLNNGPDVWPDQIETQPLSALAGAQVAISWLKRKEN